MQNEHEIEERFPKQNKHETMPVLKKRVNQASLIYDNNNE